MKLILTLLVLVIFSSCKKEENRSCFKSIGENSSIEINLSPVDELVLKSDITYVLFIDTLDKVIIKGGKNLLNFVTIDQSGKRLAIENGNDCSFLRNYEDDIIVEIHASNLRKIAFAGTKKLINSTPLQLDSLWIDAFDGSGIIQLNVQTNFLKLSSDFGYTDFIINGTSDYLLCNLGGSSYANLYNLVVNDSITVVSNTQRDILVKPAAIKLKAQLNQSGNVLYKGIPSSIFYTRYGKGELINKN
jgi:hypothetical protein